MELGEGGLSFFGCQRLFEGGLQGFSGGFFGFQDREEMRGGVLRDASTDELSMHAIGADLVELIHRDEGGLLLVERDLGTQDQAAE